jgi:hypothetical protein
MIDREKVYTYMDHYHGPLELSTNGWYSCSCPICGKKKFAVNFIYLIGKCWTGCVNTFLIDIIRQYHGINYFEALELIDQQEPGLINLPAAVSRVSKSKVQLPKGYHPILEGNTSFAVRAREYLEGRGFDLNYLDRIGIGYCNEADENPKDNYLGYIIIPFKREGILTYFIGRDFIGNHERYKNPAKEIYNVGKSTVIFNEEALYIESKVYLTEGWSCAATIQRKGISQQGSTPSVIQRNMIIKSPITEVVVVPDAGFYFQGLQAARFFLPYKKVKVVNMDFFNLSGIGKDVNEIGLENLYNLESKTPYTDQNFLYKQLKAYNNKTSTLL